MNSPIPNSVKKEIHKFLLSKMEGVQLANFRNEYKQLTGHDLDYSSFGFRSLKELFLSMPDVARVVLVTKDNTEKVYGVADRSLTSMNGTEKKARCTPEDDKTLLTSNTKDRKESFSKAGSPKDSLRQFAEKNLQCNRKGLWSLCFVYKKPISNKEIYHIFSPFSPVAQINITERYAFVRFKTKEYAIKSYIHLKEKLDLQIASEKINMAEPRMKHNTVPNHGNDASTIHKQWKKNHHIKKGHLDGGHFSSYTMPLGRGTVVNHVNSAVVNGFDSYRVSNTTDQGRLQQESLSVSGSSNQMQGAAEARTLNDRISMPELTSTWDDESFDDMPSLEDIDGMPALEDDNQQCYEEQVSIMDQSFNSGSEQSRSHENGHISLRENDQGAKKQHGKGDSSVRSYSTRDSQGRRYQQEADVFELCVMNFPYGTDTEDLLKPFMIYGASNIKMVNNEPKKGTLAFVQFKDYESAVEAFISLDDQDFRGRNLHVMFSRNTFCPDNVVYKKLEDLKIRVNVESTQASSKKREAVTKSDNDLMEDTCQSSKYKPQISSSEKQPKQEWQPMLTEENQRQKQAAKHYQVASQARQGKLLSCGTRSPKPDLSSRVKKIPNQQSVKEIKSVNGSVRHDLHSDDQGGMSDSSSDNCMERNHRHCYQGHQIQGTGHAETPATLKLWSSEAGKDMANSMSCGTDVSDKPEALNDHLTDMASSVPLMMRRHIMEQMRKDVCPGCHLLTVNDMLPHITIWVSYIENDTYFWGCILNSQFKENIEELIHLNKSLAEITHNNTVKGNRASIKYQGEWSRVWIFRREALIADIMHVDYGNTERVDYSRLSEIPNELWQLPPQAIPFRLKDPSQFSLVQYSTVEVTVDPSAGEDHIITVFK